MWNGSVAVLLSCCLVLGVPGRPVASNSDSDGEPDPKAPRIEDETPTASTPLPEWARPQCFIRNAIHTNVVSDCEGELTALSEVTKIPMRASATTTAIGVGDMADLLLTRGAARFQSHELRLDEIFICQRHENELKKNMPWDHESRRNFNLRTARGKSTRRRGFSCAAGEDIGGIAHGSEEVFATEYLSKDGSAAILKYSHSQRFYAMGTPMCDAHHEAVQKLEGRYRDGETPSGSFVSSQQQSQSQPWGHSLETPDTDEEEAEAAEARCQRQETSVLIRQLGQGLGVPIHITSKDWATLSTKNKKTKARQFIRFMKGQCDVIHGEEHGAEAMEMVMQGYCSRSQRFTVARSSPQLDKILQNVANMWYNASSPMEKKRALSLVADNIHYATLLDYIPGLTYYYFTEGRKYAREWSPGALGRPLKITRKRWTENQVACFVDWIVSSGGFVTDLPFGEVIAKKDDGTKVPIPALLRQLDHSRIIITYEKHLAENEQAGGERLGLSHSTYRAILHRCKALQRHSVKGLDYYAKEGLDAFNDLEDIYGLLQGHTAGPGYAADNPFMDIATLEESYKNFKRAKNYLRVNFKGHVKKESDRPDHCLNHALSDPAHSKFRVTCSHEHDIRCKDCERVKNVLGDLTDFVSYLPTEGGVREKQTAILNNAKASLDKYKAHQLRTVNQDRARADILENMGYDEAFITLDWAMKHLPVGARETQGDWYGKRGVSWLVAVVIMKFNPTEDMLQEFTSGVKYRFMERVYVFVLPQSNQNGADVAGIVEELILQLSMDATRIDPLRSVYMRSDKASCFHNSLLFRTLHDISTRLNVNIRRWDFSEPQSGKSSCDRHAARIKQNIKRMVNGGGDCRTAEQFVKCITMSDFPNMQGGLKGVITLRHLLLRQRRSGSSRGSGSNSEQGSQSLQLEGRHAKFFYCPEPGCKKTYTSGRRLENHLTLGNHDFQPDHESLLDTALGTYENFIERRGISALPLNGPEGDIEFVQEGSEHPPAELGWALFLPARSPRFNREQRNFLEDLYWEGKHSKQKYDPMRAAQKMRDELPSQLWLKESQIQGFFSRFTAEMRKRHAETGGLDRLQEMAALEAADPEPAPGEEYLEPDREEEIYQEEVLIALEAFAVAQDEDGPPSTPTPRNT